MERTKIISIVGLIGLGILIGIFTPLYFITNANYSSLLNDYRDLEEDHQDLSDDYYDLLNDYHILTGDYNTLFDDYEDLEAEYNSVCSTIKQQILPVQYSIFAEAVRRYYMPLYLEEKSGSRWQNLRFNAAFLDYDQNNSRTVVWYMPEWSSEKNYAGSGMFFRKQD